ncbi:MAG: exo-alpha-sialidase [Clostridia bacterium]|nr:exo-alpha-sialidase [Clostridia bacterium]
MKILENSNGNITFSGSEVFADLEHTPIGKRSGHLGHAMAECRDGSILAFYSNCSGLHGGKYQGHTMYGWVEYKRSTDCGLTWSEPKMLDYSYKCFLDGVYKIGCEKAVVCDDGTIVLFCLRSIGYSFEPYATPVCLLSHDNGETWSEPIEVHNERGRIYDAIYRNGRIYVLEFCNSTDKGFTCEEEGLFYKIIASDDCGKSFYVLSALPFDTMGHAYGNMIFRKDGSLVFYGYNVKDEYNLTGLISEDCGVTWGEAFKMPVAKIARNPQVGYVNGKYILHARSEGGVNFVMYHSDDGINWDAGTIVNEPLCGHPRGGCYYSNNMTVKGADGKERLLVQYSEQYDPAAPRVYVCHAWVEVK